MSGSRLARLLEALADGPDLSRAAADAGYERSAEAAEELRGLAKRRQAAAKRAGNPAEPLPGPCPDRSPFPPGTVAYANADGGSRGNPGPAAYGCAYSTAEGVVLCAEGATIGRATNNVAEYRGAIAALTRLSGWGVKRAILRMDSQLVVRQLDGSYRVKDAGLKPLHAEASALLGRFESIELEYVPRKENAVADRFANLALDGKL